jgi:hypothetical protein
VDVLQETSENTYASWYLTFSTLSGLAQYIGYIASVVSDGKYIGDYFIDSATLDLEEQYSLVQIGYRYRGVIKSFALGIQIQAFNTQITMKAIKSFDVRCVATVGLKVGSNPYRMARVQDMGDTSMNYLPPLPIDGTKNVPFTDDFKKDKFFYIVQDEPGPATVSAVMLTTNQTVTA